MKLPVLQDDVGPAAPWYAGGLKFTCTTCGNCCTGGPGYVWVTEEEVRRLAEHLGLTVPQTLKRYCRKVGGRISFKEKRGPGGHDCIFLEERPAERGMQRALSANQPIPLTRRICPIYSVRPLQCRTWPFWPENLQSPAAWEQAAARCHGMNHGHRHFTAEQIESLRDAEEWPDNPPTSRAGAIATFPMSGVQGGASPQTPPGDAGADPP